MVGSGARFFATIASAAPRRYHAFAAWSQCFRGRSFALSRIITVADPVILVVNGEVDRPAQLSLDDLAAIEANSQVADVSRLDPKRRGKAVTLAGLLAHVRVRPTAQYLTLHSASDDFHASVPLAAVRERGLLIYALDDGPLPAKAGGPVRFLIPDYAACHTDEVDECANVKFVDHIELTAVRGRDNRPSDEEAHADLHRREEEGHT